MAWGSYMWALREHYTSAKATPAIVQAYRALHPGEQPTDYQAVFLKELVAAGLDETSEQAFEPVVLRFGRVPFVIKLQTAKLLGIEVPKSAARDRRLVDWFIKSGMMDVTFGSV